MKSDDAETHNTCILYIYSIDYNVQLFEVVTVVVTVRTTYSCKITVRLYCVQPRSIERHGQTRPRNSVDRCHSNRTPASSVVDSPSALITPKRDISQTKTAWTGIVHTPAFSSRWYLVHYSITRWNARYFRVATIIDIHPYRTLRRFNVDVVTATIFTYIADVIGTIVIFQIKSQLGSRSIEDIRNTGNPILFCV